MRNTAKKIVIIGEITMTTKTLNKIDLIIVHVSILLSLVIVVAPPLRNRQTKKTSVQDKTF